MLPSLCAAVPDHTVVLRPHPSENQAIWHAIAERCPNLRVVNEGSITHWLMAAKAVVANGCTSLVESAVLDTPAIAFQPIASAEFDDDLPNSLSRRAYSVDELCSTVRAVTSGKLGPLDQTQRRKILDQHIAGLDGPLAADRMVAVLETAGYDCTPPPPAPPSQFVRGWLHNNVRTLVKRINMRRPGHRNNIAFHDHRFPRITVDEIMKRVERLGKLLNRFETVRVEQRSKHIFTFCALSASGKPVRPR
jgi:hypothetical protein